MEDQPNITMTPARNGSTDAPSGSQARIVETEDLYIRNYDHQWAYDLDLVVHTPAGTPVVRERYYLQPGEINSVPDLVPDGEYELQVTLDNAERETLACRISSRPEETAVVEVGNNALSLTEGLHA